MPEGETSQPHLQPPQAIPPAPSCESTTDVFRLEYQRPPSVINTPAESHVRTTWHSDAPHPLRDSLSGVSSAAVSTTSVLEKSAPIHTASRAEILSLIFRQTAVWVFGGIGVMIVGIGLAWVVILPRINNCLYDTNCLLPPSMGSTSAITLLQTLMHYWLQAGMLIASVGLLKLSAYQAWFILMHNGNTIKNLDLNLGAIRGNILDAARLAFRTGSRWLSAYVLGQLGISTAISLIIGLSIIRKEGTHTFTYSSTIRFPDSRVTQLGSVGQLRAIAEVVAWVTQNDTSHSSAYRGSLVIPDARNASISQAGGPRIKGTLSCTGYNGSSPASNFSRFFDAKLAKSLPYSETALSTYIWASNTTGMLPNATRTPTSHSWSPWMYMSLCTHKIIFVDNTEYVEGVQEIQPSKPLTSGCNASDPYVCVSDAVNMAIMYWWTQPTGYICRGSVLGPLPPLGVPEEDYCPLTEELWSDTVTSMLDALVQTGRKDIDARQTLLVPGATIDSRRWWLQALIPFLTLFLYVAGLCYTIMLSQGRSALKELTLTEIIEAAQTEYVRTLVDSGSLAKAMVQYESEVGFTIPDPSRLRKRHGEKPA